MFVCLYQRSVVTFALRCGSVTTIEASPAYHRAPGEQPWPAPSPLPAQGLAALVVYPPRAATTSLSSLAMARGKLGLPAMAARSKLGPPAMATRGELGPRAMARGKFGIPAMGSECLAKRCPGRGRWGPRTSPSLLWPWLRAAVMAMAASAPSSCHNHRSKDGTAGRAPGITTSTVLRRRRGGRRRWRRWDERASELQRTALALRQAEPPGNELSERICGAMREKAICTTAAWLAGGP